MALIPENTFTHNNVTLIGSGRPYFNRLLQLIHEAKQVIHLQVYIFDLDATGMQVLEALQQASSRGVEIFVVVDAYASEHINEKNMLLFTEHGIHVKRFSPLKAKKGWGLGRRMHHKIFWVDGHTALIGGINIADKYSGVNGQEPWLDFAVEVQGPLCARIRKVCDEVLPKRWTRRLYQVAYTGLPLQSLPHLSRITKNDWLRRRIEISGSYRQAIRRADKSLIIVASYFLPGNRIRRLLKRAVERGVLVRVVLVGNSDVPLVKPAMTYLYDWMLRNNILIYEWKKSVLHGKLAVADHQWVTVGSYNLNALSDYGSLELNVEVMDKDFARETERTLETIIANGCEPVNEQQFLKHKNWISQFLRWLSYVLVRLSLRVLFALMQGRKTPHL